MEEKDEYQNVSLSNNYNNMSPTFIDLRLNTKGLLEDLENFLSAKRIVIEEDGKGGWYQRYEQKGLPLANSEGVTAILNMVLLRTHHHCIQGNFDKDHYWSNLCKTRKEIAAHIVMNCYNWGIDDSKLNFVIDTIMDYVEKVGSRLIDNKERESYMQQFVSKEQLISNRNQKQNALASFSGGMKGAS